MIGKDNRTLLYYQLMDLIVGNIENFENFEHRY